MSGVQESVLIDGYLNKCGVGRFYSKWTNRWCVLTSHSLVYYKDDSLTSKKGEYEITEGCQVTRYQGDVKGELSVLCCLKRVGSNPYELLLHCEDNATLLRWFEQIQQALNDAKERNTPSNILTHGLLHKCGVGMIFSKWTTRWCILTGNSFVYYEDESLTKKRGEYTITDACEITRNSSATKFCIEYCLEKRGKGSYKLLLGADDEATMDHWITHIRNAIQQQKSLPDHARQPSATDSDRFSIRESVVNFSQNSSVSPQPFVLRLSILSAEGFLFSLASKCYIKVLVRTRYFGKTGVQQSRGMPTWGDNFSIPLTHLKQGQLTLELWDQSRLSNDVLLGKAVVNFNEIPISVPVVNEHCEIMKPSGEATSSALIINMYVEEKMDNIRVISEENNHVMLLTEQNEVACSALNDFMVEQCALINASNKIIKAFQSSDVLSDMDASDHYLIRDMIFDAAHIYPSAFSLAMLGDDDNDEDEMYTCHEEEACSMISGVPMISYPIAENVDVIKATDISFSVLPAQECSDFCHHDCSFLLKLDDDEIVFVAPNKYVVYLWIKEIRRQFVNYKMTKGDNLQVYADQSEDNHTQPRLDDYATTLDGPLQVLQGKLRDCICSLNFETLQLKYYFANSNDLQNSIDLRKLRLISVAQDFAFPSPLNTRVTVKAGRIALDKSQKKRSQLGEIKLKFTNIDFAKTKVVLNSNEDVNVLHTGVAEGIMPYWNKCKNIYLSMNDIYSILNRSMTGDDKAAGVHLHMLMGEEGREKVLGSKFIPYSELLPADSMKSNILQNIDAPTKPFDKVYCLDTFFGFRVDVIRGENLLMPPSFDDDTRRSTMHEVGILIESEKQSNILMSGFLNKCVVGRVYSKWKKRWCVLTQDAFIYYTDESMTLKKGEYSVTDTCRITRKSEDMDHSYVCCLQRPGHTGYEILLSSDDEDIMASWFEGIHNVIDDKFDIGFRESNHFMAEGDGVDRDPHVKMSFVSSKCLKRTHYCIR